MEGVAWMRTLEHIHYNPLRATSRSNPVTHELQPSNAAHMDITAVLSAERYDVYDERLARASDLPRTEPQKRTHSNAPAQPFGKSRDSVQRNAVAPRDDIEASQTESPKGKKRNIVLSDGGEDGASKRARGRPRLDIKDASAADRRRTQIRLAQRAYRNRKETTISSLEKQVQDLRSTNEQMSNTFMALYDYAMDGGLASREPEFATLLQSTTEQFLLLAKAAGESTEDNEVHTSHETHAKDTSPKPAATRFTSSEGFPTDGPSLNQTSSEETSISAPWGYNITREVSSWDPQATDSIQTDYNQQSSKRRDHHIIAQATPDNASFLFGSHMFDMQQNHVEATDPFQHSISAFDTCPSPKSYSSTGTSFARRLTRAALERGYDLLNSNAHSEIIESVFGFSLRFESLEQIKTRIQGLLASNVSEPLFEWREPFVHLGGSGTSYPIYNPDISGPLQPKSLMGMSMGSHSATVNEIRDNAMEDIFLTTVPGFTGAFFDPNDVEGYLRGIGIEILPSADLVNVDLDELAMHNLTSFGTEDSANSGASYSPPSLPSRSPDTRSSCVNTVSSTSSSCVSANLNMDSANNSVSIGSSKNNSISHDLLDSQYSGALMFKFPPAIRTGADGRSIFRRTATLNVQILMNELMRGAKCLGRSPGFRPADVDAAVKRTVLQAL